MTWLELANKINAMTDEQRNTDVTFFDFNDREFYRLMELRFTDEAVCDVLDHDHPYLAVFEDRKGYSEDECEHGLEVEAVCEGCGEPCEYDSEVCLCDNCINEQTRRDEKNGLYPEKADISN